MRGELIMKKMYAVILVVAIVISIGAVVIVVKKSTDAKNYYDSTSASVMEKTLYNVSKDLKNHQEIVGDYDITEVDESELDARAEIVAKNSNRNKAEVKSELKERIERKKALYLAAKEAGYNVTDEEIEQAVQETKEAIHAQKDSENEFKAVLNGMGVSENEYWELQKKQYEIDLLINKYMEDQMAKKEIGDKKNIANNDYEIKNKVQKEIEDEALEKYGESSKKSSDVKN